MSDATLSVELQLNQRIAELEAELKAEREQRERGCFHCKHFVGYHHAGKIDGQCTVKDCRCKNYQTAADVIREERERLDEARRGLVRAGERLERAEAALVQIAAHRASSSRSVLLLAEIAEEALKSVSSDPEERP